MEKQTYSLGVSLTSLSSTSSDSNLEHGKADYSASASSSSIRSDTHVSNKPHVDVPSAVRQALVSKGLIVDSYGVVCWDGHSSSHPRRWSIARKTYNSAVICTMEFVMTLVSNAGSTIVPKAMSELGIGREAGLLYFTTLYLLGQATGGLILPPLAESYASSRIYTTSAIGFSAACVIIGSCPSVAVVAVFRFISGFLSAMPCVVAAGSIENMWDTKARIWLIHIWIASSVLGLAFAPPVTTAIDESQLGWHWLFYMASIITIVISILCVPMRESRPSQLLRQELDDIRHDHRFWKLSVRADDCRPDMETFLRTSLTLPVRMFFTEPIVFLTSIMGATVYGAIYLFSAALPAVYQDSFHFSALQSSSVFMAIAVGVVASFLPRLYDMRLLGSRDQNSIQPEEKLFGFYVAAPVLAIGLWWFGLAMPPLSHASAWASIPSLALFGFRVVEFDNVLSGYLCDTYASRTASAIAPMSFLRAILSSTFPLFGLQMFEKLNANNALFVLAGVATAFCVVAALFGMNGRRIRQRSPLAERMANGTGRPEMQLT